MKKSKFYFLIILYTILVIIPLFVLGLFLIILNDGIGMILGGIASWGVLIYFAKKLYDFISFNGRK